MARRRLLVFGLVGSLIVIGVMLRWVVRDASHASLDPREWQSSGEMPGAVDMASGGGPLGSAPPVEQLPVTVCWKNLSSFDKNLSLTNFRAALAAALSANDQHLTNYLQERLAELVGDDPQKALEVVDWAETSSPPALGVYMEALKKTPAVQNEEVSERLVGLGESKTVSLEHRSAAIDALETQRRLSDRALSRLTAVAMDETVDSTAWVATRTLGRVMKEDYARTGNFDRYWKQLLQIGERSNESAVRVLALEMPSYSNPLVDRASMDRLGNILHSDPERDVREMAAFRLAVTTDPQRALDIFRGAFAQEKELCVRWAIVRFAVRAAGEQALPLLAQFAAQDPRFQQDYLDFKALYAQGTVDFARVWFEKQERHQCPEEGEGEEGRTNG
ncbi:HEAT repeat domain-containing protein [Pendulispora rubella]|uniref:HEAT repeat domain-containing protein n=1 Tax=Pendulispora rubella TaxID=2741070 RepID=A0ABZ2L145_9BACT